MIWEGFGTEKLLESRLAKNTTDSGESRILKEFHESYCIENGLRVVRLPKKNMCEPSPNGRKAERRIRSLQKRLRIDDALREIYEE